MRGLEVGCPRTGEKIFFGLNRKKLKLNLIRLFFGMFHETTTKCSVCFWSFEPLSKQPKQILLFRNKQKQTKEFFCRPYISRCSTGSSRQTRPDAAQALLERHVQVQHRLLRQTHPGAAQELTIRCGTDLVQIHVQMQHNSSLLTGTYLHRCNKSFGDVDQIRPGETQAAVGHAQGQHRLL
jgi:hypothetical protein